MCKRVCMVFIFHSIQFVNGRTKFYSVYIFLVEMYFATIFISFLIDAF